MWYSLCQIDYCIRACLRKVNRSPVFASNMSGSAKTLSKIRSLMFVVTLLQSIAHTLKSPTIILHRKSTHYRRGWWSIEAVFVYDSYFSFKVLLNTRHVLLPVTTLFTLEKHTYSPALHSLSIWPSLSHFLPSLTCHTDAFYRYVVKFRASKVGLERHLLFEMRNDSIYFHFISR